MPLNSSGEAPKKNIDDAVTKLEPMSPRIKEFKDTVTGMEFVFVKGGCYEMGDTFGDGDSDEKPAH